LTVYIFLFLLTIPHSLISILFPYTTLFRSLLTPSQPNATHTSTSAESEYASNYLDDASSVFDKSGSLGPFLETTITRSKQIKNTDRKSTRLNSSHVKISYAVFCLKKKRKLT